MELLITLSALTISGILISIKSYRYEVGGYILTLFAGIFLLIHVLFMCTASYRFNKFVIQRKAFTQSLEYARKTENQLELASLTREVSEWNQQLAIEKYDNTVFILKDYIDDRIISLKPIH